jgi:hypothetical protein
MVNYNNGLIYKLCCKDPHIKDEYIGSTCNFNRRKQQHKDSCYYERDGTHYNLKVYQKIRETGWDNWDMVLIEKVSCEDKMELHKKEREFIERLKPSLNCGIPLRTNKEWQEDNKEVLKEKKKEYYEDNKKEILEKQKVYQEKNNDKYKVYKKEYYLDNKVEIKEKRKVKVRCEICNCELRKDGLPRHNKSKNHIKNLSK